MKYRSDIDGLRSLAILPVVLYHAGVSLIPGGFTGVDIFFVISGFLITTIIRTELMTGEFSILEFYKRRVLRIVPALSVVLLSTFVVASIVMLPTQFVDFGGSVIAAALFFSNIFFWQANDGYFVSGSDYFPLLHTWSLAVEEQFYVFFPLLMMFIAAALRGRYALTIAGLCLISFVVCLWGTVHEPSATFYLLPTRAWELGVGALLAVITLPAVLGRLREVLALAGIALLMIGIFTVRADMPFPGTNALYPVIGAGLIIAFAQGTLVGRCLSAGPLVWIGKISYSLYLWHWPVIVFYQLQFDAQPDGWGMAAMIAISVLLATLSYYFVEQPFRSKAWRLAPTPRVLSAGGGALVAAAAIGIVVFVTGSTWKKLPEDVEHIASFIDYTAKPDYTEQFRPGICMIGSSNERGLEEFDRDTCLALAEGQPNYLVLGDSHAGHIWRAISDGFPEANVIQATASGCRPTVTADGKKRCLDMINYVLDSFVPTAGLDGVILAARWEDGDKALLLPTISYLKQYTDKVIVFGPTVEYAGEVPILLAKSRLSGNDGLLLAAVDPTRKALSDELAQIIDGSGAHYVPLFDYICQQQSCWAETQSGEPLQFDYGHFTLSGAMELVRMLKDDAEHPLILN